MLAYTFLQLCGTSNLSILLIWYTTPSWNALGHHNYRKEQYGSNCSCCNKRHTRSYHLKQSRKPNCHHKFAHAMKTGRLVSDKRQPAPIRKQHLLKSPFNTDKSQKNIQEKNKQWPNLRCSSPRSSTDMDVTTQASTRLCQRGKRSVIYRNMPQRCNGKTDFFDGA